MAQEPQQDASGAAYAEGYKRGLEDGLERIAALRLYHTDFGAAAVFVEVEEALAYVREHGCLEGEEPGEEGCPSCHIIGGHVVGCCNGPGESV